MERTDQLKQLDKLLRTCSTCDLRKVPYSPRSHEHRNSYCIKECKEVGPHLRQIGKQLEEITKKERAKKRGQSA